MTISSGSSLRKRPSLRLALLTASPYILLAITGVVLAASPVSLNLLQTYGTSFVLYAFLTAFALVFASLLSQGELSPSHMIGIVALLGHPLEAMPLMTWALFTGGTIGAALRVLPAYRQFGRTRLRAALFIISRVTLSFWASSVVYLAAGGLVPLGRLSEDLVSLFLPLVIYGLVYITLYFSIFLLELYSDGHSVVQLIRNDLSRIAFILILPMPFAVLGAEIFTQLGGPSELVFLAGLILIILALNALTHSAYRLRKQVDELRTLGVVTQSMRSHLNMDALLRTIYVQISQLLQVDSFIVALQSSSERALTFPLVIQRGYEVNAQQLPAVTRTLVEHVLMTEQPLLLERDVRMEAVRQGVVFGMTSRETAQALDTDALCSWLAIPITTSGGLLGVIAVASYSLERSFTRDDLRLLSIIAASSGITIENAQLYQQQTERAEQLVTLNRIAGLLSGTLSPDKVLDTVISSASAISSANAIGVYLFWDDAHLTLPLVRSAGLSNEFIMDAPDPISFSQHKHQTQERGALTSVIAPVTVEQVASDARTAGSILMREGIMSLVELPLEVGAETLGALVIYYRQPQRFTNDKVELFKTFATQAAQAINNAKMYSSTDEAFQRSVEQLLTLSSIGRVLTSTIDLKNICDLILSQVADATGVDTGLVMLRDELTGHSLVFSHDGADVSEAEIARQLAESQFLAQTLESGEVHRIEDIRRQEGKGHPPLNRSTLSQLIVPIMRGVDSLGVIILESNRVNGFTEEDSNFVIQIANQSVIAIDNARLFDSITEARDRLRVLLDAMEEAIILLDERGRIELVNPRIDLLGLRQQPLTNQMLLALGHEETLQIVERTGFASLEDMQGFVDQLQTARVYPAVNYVVQGQHGLLHIRRQIIPIRGNEQEILGVLLIFYNKTEEEELARTREEMSRMIVHDLRSPLTAVTTSLKMLRELVPKDAGFYPLVETTTDASRRAIRKLLNRVDSLLDVSRMESGQISIEADLVELNFLVESVRQELAPLAQELGVVIEARIHPNTPPLDVDSDKVERVLLNLVDNALKYTPSNTVITVRNHPVGEAGAPAGYMRIDVIDQGPGVPLEYKQTLFDRFVQIEGRRKVRRGVGLGLTFCRLVTEAHGGHIWIEDNPTGGSVFAFTLPAANMTPLD